ncbi:MAG: hypothetical protein QME61_04065 [Patescibacteria group bacterium]|nr:hypothetical protein [Patescibacteria group bacterium]
MVFDWYTITLQALQGLWQGFLTFLPKLVGALIVFLIGWFIAVGIGKLVTEILKKLKFNQIFEKGVWKEALEKAEIKIDASGFIGAICKWILVIVFLLATVEILGFVQFADFLVRVLAYLPNVIVAVLIFIVAVIIADIVEKVVRAAAEGIKVGYGYIVGVIVKWSIWIFAILAILIQLKVAPTLLQTLFTGFVALLAIAGGIAFGLGGKDVAAELLQELKKKLKG